MRHHKYNQEFKFVVNPIEFNRFSEKEVLEYALGATMYMPGTKDFTEAIINKKYPGLTTMVMCFEDACKEEDVPFAENNVLHLLDVLNESLDSGVLEFNDLPLIIFRVRNVQQFKEFTGRLKKEHIRLITAFNFPKLDTSNADAYFSHLQYLNEKYGEVIYGMPILESESIAYVETRSDELIRLKNILDKYQNLVLNIRVGGTDFSSCFGLRRGIDYTIYDILTVRDCLCDILNIFSRRNDYVVSGPVWEYFRATKEMMFDELPEKMNDSIFHGTVIINDAVDGLLRELLLDQANGFIGKTIIHPTHLPYVNGMLAVTQELYEDALQILGESGGVIKSKSANKMNEIGPHRCWAEKILMRAKVYGVIEDDASYFRLFSGNA